MKLINRLIISLCEINELNFLTVEASQIFEDFFGRLFEKFVFFELFLLPFCLEFLVSMHVVFVVFCPGFFK